MTDAAVRPGKPPTELTVRGLLLGAVITVIFTAANVFFGLKAGLTFASSIPAAVISMALLRGFKNSTIQENNIVQTVASAAGTLSSVIFILPGLVIVGVWLKFPFWASFGVCALGGVLGVMYSIPLRRALVTDSDLPYPEGVACAEVLKVGSGAGSDPEGEAAAEGKAGLLTVLVGSIASGLFAIVVATKVFAGNLAKYFPFAGGGTGYNIGLSLALFGVGHLVGLWVGVAMLVGVLISWLGTVPYLSAHHYAAGDAAAFMVANHVKPDDFAGYIKAIFKVEGRLVGAGIIGVAAIWTLVKLVAPIIGGLRSAFAAQAARKAGGGAELPLTERDMPIGIVGLIGLICLVPMAWQLYDFAMQGGGGLAPAAVTLAIFGVAFTVVMGFLVSAVCGYMAGLVGSSNSPLSGVGILATVAASVLLVILVRSTVGSDGGKALIAFTLFLVSFTFNVASIANNNLQDLKTGQLVEATPWKQQVALVAGTLVGAAVIPPVLNVLAQAYGFAGAPGAGENALAAPQASLMSFLAQGVITGNLRWDLIGAGAAIGVGVIVLDEILGRLKLPRLAPLAVGLGVYLPQDVTLMIIVGAILGHIFERMVEKRPGGEATKRLGVLLASGLIVGESLVGVVIAGIVAGTGKETPLALVGDDFGRWAEIAGAVAFAVVVLGLYRWTAGLIRTRATA